MITAAADGSSLSNPGPAGWAWYVSDDCWAAGGWPHGTNNMGELMAVLDLLRQTASAGEPLLVLCDSQYVINSVTKWMPGWKRKGWRKGDGKPVMNVELLQEIDREIRGREVRFEWVRGHAGHEMNEAADLRARAAATAFRDGGQVDHGPGFDGAGSTPAAAPVDQPSARPAEPATLFDEPAPADAVSTHASSGARNAPRAPQLSVESDTDPADLERRLLALGRAGDVDAVDDLLHPDYVEIGADGRLLTRGRLLAALATAGQEPGPDEVEHLGVDTVDADVVLVRWRARTGRRQVVHAALWQRSASGWQCRHHQATPVTA